MFDYSLDYQKVNFRKHPELYRVGRGEQGVLLVEPYKSELLPHWRFRTVGEARKSARTIHRLFLTYLRAGDFVGDDMARKFLQMGWTRGRRYANHKGGRKYDRRTGVELPRTEDVEKASAAEVFYLRYVAARQHPAYVRMKSEHRQKYESPSGCPGEKACRRSLHERGRTRRPANKHSDAPRTKRKRPISRA